MIKFNTLKIENFRSIIEPMIISFPDRGIIRFRGKNGSGKTSVMEALYFSIFGESLKQGGTLQSNLTGNPLKITLTFNVSGAEYKIERGTKTVSLYKLVDGNYVSIGLYKKDIDASIQEIFGITSMQFQNAIIMASASRRLADYSEPERREFFKALFDLDWIDALRVKVQADQTRIKNDIALAESALKATLATLATQQQNIDNFLKLQNEAESVYAQSLEQAMLEYEKANQAFIAFVRGLDEPKLMDLSNEKAKEASLAALSLEYMTQIARNSVSISNYEGRISKLRSKPPKEPAECCNTCGRPFDTESLIAANEEYKAQVAEMQDDIAANEQQLNALRASNDELKSLRKASEAERVVLADKIRDTERTYSLEMDSYRAAVTEHKLLENKLHNAAKALERIQLAQPTDYSVYIEQSTDSLRKAKASSIQIEAQLESLREELAVAEYWYKDALSPNGIKAHITKALFVKLNIALDRYSKLFGLAIRFTIDADATYTKTELIVSRADGVIVPYGDLSQGQVTRVQLTLQLGLYDLIAQDKWTLMLVDEPFLGLDEDACSAIMELLPILAKSRAIFLVDQQLGEFPNSKTYNFALADRKTIMQ